MILLPQKWRRQPTVPMVVDWNHPLAQDLLEFGYALPGCVPYSAVAAGSQQPFVTGAGTQDATTNGQAITVNGTGNYIDLGRNISAPTQVATLFARTTWHGVVTPAITCANVTGTAFVGHTLQFSAVGGLVAQWGDGGGTAEQDRRTAASASGTFAAGEVFSAAGVCRGPTDWSLYKDGRNLGPPTYSGTAGAYAPGVANGTINFRAPTSDYGQQSASTWAVFAHALDDGEMQALHEAPFQLLVKRQRRIWVAVSGVGGKGFPFQPPMRGFIHMLVR